MDPYIVPKLWKQTDKMKAKTSQTRHKINRYPCGHILNNLRRKGKIQQSTFQPIILKHTQNLGQVMAWLPLFLILSIRGPWGSLHLLCMCSAL